ncbi:MAG: PIG-L family deacetylase [Acidimicrobiaceae bacterium]|nr:PIG-L family deacetylase [Acidimicrobiaceae bacterium]
MAARTLMAIHAHPDDEVISTGGVLARYAGEGVRTVVVTCTDGSQGFGPGGSLPGEPGHDRDAVASVRKQELERSCTALGVGHLEMLGYRDSGMAGWDGNRDPEAFCNLPVEQGAARVAALIEQYQPQVVVTYDERGGYGHPDHIQTHRVAMAAVDSTSGPAKVYFTARSQAHAERMSEVRRRLQLDQRPGRPRRAAPVGVPDATITTTVDTGAALDRKRAALEAHASQLADTVWVKIGEAEFGDLFGQETFIRVRDVTGALLPETDLFAGL